jgi:ethanolamine phosphate transferase 2 subunit G
MSNAASEYDLNKLYGGIVAALLGTVAAFAAIFPRLGSYSLSVVLFIIISVSYGAMMLGSSYVEEEQHFWFWAATGWILVLFVKE